MTFGKFFLFSAAMAVPAGLSAVPAAASIMVIGNSLGADCYKSARAERWSRAALQGCNAALETGMLSFRDIVATHVNRGIVRLHGEDYDGAIADFDRAIALDPKQAESYLNKGSTYLRKGESPREAAALFTEALNRDTLRPELAYYGRAIAHEISGDLKSAYLDYQRASSARPDWAEPREELARFTVKRR
jgi:tetratricopeptide (TPR) repeat protein